MAEQLSLAPPTLFNLFPELTTIEQKAFKFLEVRYECGSDRRAAKRLLIDHKTVKSIYEFLNTTEIGFRFNAMLAEQTQDFYSKKTLVDVFELINAKITEIQMDIKAHPGNEHINLRLKLNAELRQWTKNLLDATMQCRPVTGAIKQQAVDNEAKELYNQYKDLLGDDFNVSGDNVPTITGKLSS